MLASAWKIVRDRLELLEQKGVANSQIRSQLANKPNLRKEYLVVCDVLGALIDALQARFSLLAATAGVHTLNPLETKNSHRSSLRALQDIFQEIRGKRPP
jgi:hypothetical protein